LGDELAIAREQACMSVMLREDGELAASRRHLEEALATFRRFGDTRDVAICLIRLGEVAQAEGDLAGSQSLYEASLTAGLDLDNASLAVRIAHHLGSVALARGDYGAAREQFVRSLQTLRERGAWDIVHSALADLASLEIAESRPERGLTLAGAVEALYESQSMTLRPTERVPFEGWVERARQALPAEAADRAWTEGLEMGLQRAVEVALAGC
jgi:tetratricopeptide (TPR) repeat protein